jgi:drug/metabolite transporter (DMT)-like permease
VLSPTAFGANATFVAALRLTSVASAVTLEQLTSLFIAALSYLLLGERYGLLSMLMLAVAVAGAIVATLADVSGTADLVSGSSPLLGDVLALVVAFLAAIYMVVFKYAFPLMKPWELVLFFLVKACVTIAGGWIVILVFNFLGWDHIGSPSSCALAWVPIRSCLEAAFNYSLIWTTVRISPLSARLSLLLAIPISFVLDLVAGSIFDLWRLVGVVLIFGGVVGFERLSRRPPATAGKEVGVPSSEPGP